jgi:primosomal protein N' (replication factor Y)
VAPKSKARDRQPADHQPVARVCVDVPLAHLDRLFDYLIDAAADEAAQPGVRVKVRFAGQMVDGWLLDRADSSEHTGKLAFVERVVSAERVLDPEVARLARAVAYRYAGNLSDVLRLAVPPRHARVEAEPPPDGGAESEPPAAGDTLPRSWSCGWNESGSNRQKGNHNSKIGGGRGSEREGGWDIVSRCAGGLATCGNAHGKLVDALADRVPRKGAGSVVVGPSMIKLIGQTPSS